MKRFLCLVGIITLLILSCFAIFKISETKNYVYSREKLAINYSEGLDHNKLLAQNIKLEDNKGTLINIVADFSAASNKIVIITPPKEGYVPGKKYKLFIDSNIKFDVEGKTVKNKVFDFIAKKEEEISFPDKNLDNAVRSQINKKNGVIYKSEIYKLFSLNGENYNIIDLRGIENFTNIRVLSLSNNAIKNIDEIKNLKQLEHLALTNNKISDIAALKNLKKLKTLWLSGNSIKDYSPVKSYFDKLTAKDFKIK